ncbi:MAG: hypothetical protein CSA19_00690 [Deltaproteobacteria bacterium]|nr:MAG: hypothetical protein CSA19_00690 [Deltaproteobacteria bacterium]
MIGYFIFPPFSFVGIMVIQSNNFAEKGYCHGMFCTVSIVFFFAPIVQKKQKYDLRSGGEWCGV